MTTQNPDDVNPTAALVGVGPERIVLYRTSDSLNGIFGCRANPAELKSFNASDEVEYIRSDLFDKLKQQLENEKTKYENIDDLYVKFLDDAANITNINWEYPWQIIADLLALKKERDRYREAIRESQKCLWDLIDPANQNASTLVMYARVKELEVRLRKALNPQEHGGGE